MDFEKFEILKGRLESYLDANAFSIDELDDNLSDPGNKDIRAIFESELKEAIDTGAISREEFQSMTALPFDDDADYARFLQEVYDYLFADGEYPEF